MTNNTSPVLAPAIGTSHPRKVGRRFGQVSYDRRAVLSYIIAHKRLNDGLSPSLREICRACNIPSTSTAAYILADLELAGEISLASGKKGIKVAGGKWSAGAGEQPSETEHLIKLVADLRDELLKAAPTLYANIGELIGSPASVVAHVIAYLREMPDAQRRAVQTAQAVALLLDYWRRNSATNIQYEKLKEYIRLVEMAMGSEP